MISIRLFLRRLDIVTAHVISLGCSLNCEVLLWLFSSIVATQLSAFSVMRLLSI